MTPRIVCLVPSITELICDLGLSEQLVARTGFCIHPWETVRRIPPDQIEHPLARLTSLVPPTFDSYIPRTLALRGWQTQPVAAPKPYPEISLDDYTGTIDRVLLSSEPYHFHEHDRQEVSRLLPGTRVSLIDGEMTSWYGSRAIAGMRYLAQYPQ